METPNTNKFLGDDMSICCKFDNPTAVTTENMMQSSPPIKGVGIVAKAAPILPKKAKTIMNSAPHWTTLLLPT